IQPLNHGSMCPTTGVAIARYTRGSIEEGPGVSIKRTGGLSSPIGCVIRSCPSFSSTQASFTGREPSAGTISGKLRATAGVPIFAQSAHARNGQIGREPARQIQEPVLGSAWRAIRRALADISRMLQLDT